MVIVILSFIFHHLFSLDLSSIFVIPTVVGAKKVFFFFEVGALKHFVNFFESFTYTSPSIV
jgi:hypothetical protein